MPDYTLSAKITGDSTSYQKAVNEADKSTEQFQKNTSSLGSKLAGGLKTGLSVAAGAIAGVSAAMGAGVVAGVKYNATIENYQTSFEVMTGSAEKAAEVVEKLKKIGAETPFEMPELADVTQLLMNYGFTADEAIDKMMMLGDISQGSADKMQRIATAYGQMSSAGKVQLEDVKQMIEAGFNPLQEISESTGESMQSLYDRISDGTLAVDEITASMQRATSEGGKYYQSMQKQSQTFSGMISTLKDNSQQLIGEVVQPISDSMVNDLLPAAIDTIDQMTSAFQTRGVDGLIQSGSQMLANVVTGMAQGLPGVILTVTQIITSVVNGLSENMPQIIAAGGQIIQAIVSGMLQLLPSIGTFAVQLVTTLYTYLTEQGPSLLQQGYQMLNNLVTGFVQAIPEMLPRVLGFVQQIGEQLAAAAPVMVQKGFELLSKLVEGITTALPILIAKVPEIISTFANIINDNFPTILLKGVELLGQLILGIIRAIPTLVANIPKIVSAIVDVIQAFNWLNLGKTIIQAFGNGIKAMLGFVKNAGKNVYDGIHNAIKNLPELLRDIGRTAMTRLSNVIKTAVVAVKNAATSVGTGILNALRKIPSQVISIGKNIVQGLWNGISNMTGWIIDKIGGFASSVVDSICNFFGINSPSTVLRDEVGEYMPPGIAVGWDEAMPGAIREMEASMDEAVKDISRRYSGIEMQATPTALLSSSESISQSYQADVSNIFDGVVIQIDNMLNMDGQPFYEKSARYTIQKIGNQQRAVLRAKGAY